MELYNYLQYSTIRIDITENTKTKSATGFFAKLNNEDILVTAKHVAEKAYTCQLHLRYKADDNEIVTEAVVCKPNWQTTHDSDLAFCKLNSIKEQLKKVTSADLYYITLTEDSILPETDELSDDLIKFVMIGYVPEGSMIRSGRIIMPTPDITDEDIDLKITGFSGSPIFTKNKQLLGISLYSETEDMFAAIDSTAFAANCHLTALKNLM